MRLKRNLKKLLAVCLAVSMLLGIAACGKKNGETDPGSKTDSVKEELAPEFVYTAEYLPMDEKNEFYVSQFLGSTMYALCVENGEDGYSQQLKKFEIADGKVGEGRQIFEVGGNGENTNINQFCVTGQGDVYVVQNVYSIPEDEGSEEEEEEGVLNAATAKPQYFLVKYSASGEKVFETDLSELAGDQEWFYVQQFAVDDAGRSYLYCNEELALYDESGKYAGKVSLGTVSWINGIGAAKDGKVYISYYQNETNSGGYMLSEVDFDKKGLGARYENFISGNGNSAFAKGVGGDLLVSDETALYEYSLADQKAEKILTWLDCDINGNSVGAFSMDQEGRIVILIRDWETNTKDIALMKKVKADEVVKKETITIGVLYSDSGLSKQVVDFNKASEQYHVTVKAYLDVNSWSENSYTDAMAALANDIVSGSGPDILDVSSIDITNYVRKGVIEDLSPYLDKSTVLKRSDFFESILEECTYDGVLAYIPNGFSLNTLTAKTSEVGEKMGWTLSDMIEYSKRHPGAALLEYSNKLSVLTMMMMLNQSRFIDEQNGKCDLDSQDFKELLAFANSFPDEFDSTDSRLTPYKLADGTLLLADAYISRFEDVQGALAYFGDEQVTFIGYPSYQGGNGCLMSVQNAYAISSKSNCKEGAWMFLENLLAKDIVGDWNFYGFSSQKPIFERQKEAATKIEYIYDENGEIMLDDNGDPIVQGSGGGWSIMDDDGETWSYESHPVTAEEAAIVEQLLDGATCYSYRYDEELMKIISDEAQVFFAGDKSVDEVASVIQNRVSLYLRENLE